MITPFKQNHTLRLMIAIVAMNLLIPSYGQDTTKAGPIDSFPANKDFVRLKNGDRITGEILRIQRGELYFDGDKTGDVTIDLVNIKILISQRKLYIIEIKDKGEFTGKINRAADGYFLLNGKDDSLVAPINDILSLRGIESKFSQRIDGNLSFGYSFTKSSDITRYNLSNALTYTSEKWQFKEIFSAIYTVGDGNGAERVDASLGAIRDLSKRWSTLANIKYQRMLELGVKDRILGVAGFGWRMIQNYHVEFNAGSGIAAQKEYAVDSSVSSVQIELPLILSFALFQLKKPDIDISTSAASYYSFSVAGRYRLDYDLNFRYEIFNDFIIGLEIFYNYDSKPLSKGTSNSDYGSVITIGYSF